MPSILVEADAPAVTSFSCFTAGPLPGLSTRTDVLLLAAPVWLASDVELAACWEAPD
jgi:hypothetical protein